MGTTQSAYGDLDTLLQSELAAIAAYTKALEKIHDKHAADVLNECRDSHMERRNTLRDAIKGMGEKPTESAGPWGAIASLVTKGATKLGDKAIISALEEGEDIGADDYEWFLVNMHGDHRRLVKDYIVPEQQATHEKLTKLAKEALGGVWPPTPDTEKEV